MEWRFFIVGVVGCCFSFRSREKVKTMETFLEIPKGIVRECYAHTLLERLLLENKKTSLRRRKQSEQGGSDYII
jgi:hypothetical protein